MTYVVTKDGRVMLFQEEREREVVAIFENERCCINKRKILKRADNIKDLFDETIIDANYKDNPFLYDRDEPVNSPEFDSEDEVVYGAIWARGIHNEPILTPIAKMNKKGGWELL